MEIVILGAGQVGATLAESLTKEGHDVAVVDLNEALLAELQQRLDIKTIVGFASHPAILRAAGIENAQLLVAVTDHDEVNMVACQVAHSLFATPMKIARIRSPHYFVDSHLFGQKDLPIDEFINPEQLVTAHIASLIHLPGTLQVFDFCGGAVKFIAVKPYYGGQYVGQSVQVIEQAYPCVKIMALFRGGEFIHLRRSTHIEVGDELFVVAPTQSVETLMRAFRRIDRPFNHIMIAGGGNIGYRLAAQLENQYQTKLIDHNTERCLTITKKLENTTVFCGDASDKSLLTNENIDHTDLFCAVTNDDEANIMSAIQAKRLGARQVLALVNRTNYIDIIEDGEINIIISPEQITISRILAFIRQGNVAKAYALHRGEVELMEVFVSDAAGPNVLDVPLSQLPLPASVIVGALVRKGEVVSLGDDLPLAPEDHLVLFVPEKSLVSKIESLFGGS